MTEILIKEMDYLLEGEIAHVLRTTSGEPFFTYGQEHLRGRNFLNNEISSWIKENNIKFETYRMSYYDGRARVSRAQYLDHTNSVLGIKFDDPEDDLYFIMRFVK